MCCTDGVTTNRTLPRVLLGSSSPCRALLALGVQPDAQIMLFSVVVGVRVHHKFGGLQLEEPGARADLHVVIVTWDGEIIQTGNAVSGAAVANLDRV